MSLLRKANRKRVVAPSRRQDASSRFRICRIEPMESRQLLSVTVDPIQVGVTYFEDSNDYDTSSALAGTTTQVADLFEVSYAGGADNTELTTLTINLKNTFFDTSSGSPGAYSSFPLTIVNHDGITITSSAVSDGGTTLTLTFDGFDAGEKLIFSIDVDEQGNLQANAVAEGAELEGATFNASFTAPHMIDATTSAITFYDDFNFANTGLEDLLPNNDYDNDASLAYVPETASEGPVYTAGASGALQQQIQPITLSGTVFYDRDADNLQDTGESGIAGVTLTLYMLNGNGKYVATGDTATTDANGNYSFTNLDPGTYKVVETQPSGYLSVGDTPGTVDGETRGQVVTVDILGAIVLEGGDDSVHNDFAEVKPASISGYVYADTDNDGVYDTGESPIGGVTLTLYGANGNALDTTTTNSSGYYSFDELTPGTYKVVETQPTGYLDGKDTAGTVGGTTVGTAGNDVISSITLATEQSGVNYNFGELLPAVISGYVYVDADNDGKFDSGESPIVGATVTLYDSDGDAVATTTTNSSGYYAFDNLAPNTYKIVETQPTGYLDGKDTAGTIGGATVGTAGNDKITSVVLASGQSGLNYNFGELLPAAVSGYVYVDADNDGKFDSGESPISSATLTLYDSNGDKVATATTNSSGYYIFENLTPGAYKVVETQPTGYLDGKDTAGTIDGATVGTAGNDIITSITLASGQSGIQYNFGEIEPVSISGRVFADMDNDDAFTAGDTLLKGVTVKLYDGDGNLVGTTTTDSKGKYSFTGLSPDTYIVVETQPSGYLEGGDQVGTVDGVIVGKLDGVDRIKAITLNSGDDGVSYDFWEIVPATISGYVFKDGSTIELEEDEAAPNIPDVRDGKLTSDDTRLSGITLQLCDASGNPLYDDNGKAITTTTNAKGYYQFTNLLPGQYSVVEVQPTSYLMGITTAGTEGGIVVNQYADVSESLLSTLVVTTSDNAIVRITLAAGESAVNYNFSHVLIDRYDTPTPPWSPNPPTSPWLPAPEPIPFVEYGAYAAPYYLTPETIHPMLTGGGGTPDAYTWHLSVIDAGQPRNEGMGNNLVQVSQTTLFDPVSWSGADLGESQWILADKDGKPVKTIHFGIKHAIPLVGDWNGDGVSTVGVFMDGSWFLDLNGNGVWDEGDLWVKLGKKDDQPVAGDWNGDAKTDIGIFGPMWAGDIKAITVEPGLPDSQNPPTPVRPKNVPPDAADAAVGWRTLKKGNVGRMRSDLIDHVFEYGAKGDIALTGDWNGDGIATVGIFRNGTWFLDMDGDGRWSKGDISVKFGQDGDLPVVGDWNGDGISKLGVYRNGTFILDTNNNREIDAADKVFALGQAGDRPVAGDWNGDGADEVGVYEDGVGGDVPLQASR